MGNVRVGYLRRNKGIHAHTELSEDLKLRYRLASRMAPSLRVAFLVK